jgi:hypothetical protein
VIALQDQAETLLLPVSRPIRPLAWSSDGRSIYYAELNKYPLCSEIWNVPVSGGVTKRYAALPFDMDLPQMTADARRLVCRVIDHESDIWLVENFDRETK